MKKCSKCNTVYDDSWGVCLNCNSKLEQLISSQPISESEEDKQKKEACKIAEDLKSFHLTMFLVGFFIPFWFLFALPNTFKKRRKYVNNPEYKYILNLPLIRGCFLGIFILGVVQILGFIALLAAIAIPNIFRAIR